MRPRPVVWWAAAAAALMVHPASTMAAAAAVTSEDTSTRAGSTAGDGYNNQEEEKLGSTGPKSAPCLFYGCPLYPQDVHYNLDSIKGALEEIRQAKRTKAQEEAINVLSTSASREADSVTLTLIGYKGGPLQTQINQDRAVVVSPFYLEENSTLERDGDDGNDSASSFSSTSDSESDRSLASNQSVEADSPLHQKRILLGVFDGHAPLGEKVSDYTATELPSMLAKKLKTALQGLSADQQDDIDARTRQALHETFVELDRTAPAEVSGGCTATVVLKQGKKIFVANAGDSRSFLVSYRPSTGVSQVLYISREDKPNLPDERARVEAAGGQVYIPARGTSRVVYHDPQTGSPTGLAMSRSIGDWAAGKMGVIPDPIVDVFDITTMVAMQLYGTDAPDCYIIDDRGQIILASDLESCRTKPVVDDVYIFAVSATDGMMDYMEADDIAKVLSHALFDADGVHPVSACEHLIFAAANEWQKAKQGKYRDDIAIAVSAIRKPHEDDRNEAYPKQ